MIGRLDRYVARMFLSSWSVSFVFFIGLYGVYEFFSKVDDLMEGFGEAGADVGTILYMYLLSAPVMLTRMAPFLMVVAVLVTVMRLQRHNELAAMVMVGRSPRRVLRPVIALTGVFLIGLVLMQEFVAPNVAIDRERLRAQLVDHQEGWTIPRTALRDADGRMFIAVDYSVENMRVRKLNVSYSDEQGFDVNVAGTNATWDGPSHGWQLEEGTMTVRSPDGSVRSEPAAFVGRSVRPQDLLVQHLEPFDMSFANLLEMGERYPNHLLFRMLRHYHVTFPLGVLMLVFLALHFALQRDPAMRMRGLGLSILSCLGYLILDAAMLEMGTSGALSPVLAAWLPVIVAGSLVLVLYDGDAES
ncbi:MAG: lipopolysaccharide export system permease protein [Pseudohongiellaceae bacterium]|jgi:lipopolysaccharide export system permease protein